MKSPNAYIKKSKGKGLGVFAIRAISKGESIERAPVIPIPIEQMEFVDKTTLYNYSYSWGKNLAIVLGFGSIYNHSYTPNACYKKFIKNRMMEFIAIEDIEKDQEICINYNCNPKDKSPLWFPVID